MIDLPSRLKQLRASFSPWSDELGWTPLWSLLYLLFLFMNWADEPLHVWLPATALSIALFLPLFFRAYRQSGSSLLAHVAAIAAIGFALAPFNTGANTYLIYAAVFLPFGGIAHQDVGGLPGILFILAADHLQAHAKADVVFAAMGFCQLPDLGILGC